MLILSSCEIRSSITAPKGFEGVFSGSGNSASRFAILSGPMKIRWKADRGKRCVNCTHTSRGNDDSARAPSMKSRTGGGVGLRPLISTPDPDRGGCSVYLSARCCQYHALAEQC